MNLSHYATFDLQGRLRVQIVTYEDVSVCNFSPNSHVLSRLPRFHTNVSPTSRVLAHVRTLKVGCVHTFLTYEDMSIRYF